MHEFSIAQSLVDVACQEARRAGAQRVTEVRCRIGALRQIDALLMQEAFAIASEGTDCASATLQIEPTYMRATCPDCGLAFELRDWSPACPRCGAEGEGIAGGDELELTGLDAELAE